MKSKPQWLSTGNISPDIIRAKTLVVKDKMGSEIAAHLEVEDIHPNGNVTISANYNSSPFPNTVSLAKFYLTQEQLDEFFVKGPKCILVAPKEISSGI